MWRSAPTILCLCLLSCCSAAQASGRPYCGIYCLYAAALSDGKDIQFPALLKEKYVGCSLGSTLGELRDAAIDHGLHAEAVANLSVADLQGVTSRAILHVRSEPAAADYDHYVLLISHREGVAELFDPNRGIIRTTLQDISALWDGSALLVSAHPIRGTFLQLHSLLATFFYACGLLEPLKNPPDTANNKAMRHGGHDA